MTNVMKRSQLQQKTGLPALNNVFWDELKKRSITEVPAVPSSCSQGLLNRDKSQEIVVRHHVKTLGTWFYTWHSWQRRILICHVMGRCSKQQLELLATSMEPILHMDFSTCLLPPLQVLHLEGMAKFQIQRTITQRLTRPEIVTRVSSQDYLSSLPTTFQTGPGQGQPDRYGGGTTKRKKSPPPVYRDREPIRPALPLAHPNHLARGHKVLPATSMGDIVGLQLHQRFTSVPDFQSAAGQLKKVREIGGRRRMGKTVSSYMFSPHMRERRAEDFKGQLRQVAIVRS